MDFDCKKEKKNCKLSINLQIINFNLIEVIDPNEVNNFYVFTFVFSLFKEAQG